MLVLFASFAYMAKNTGYTKKNLAAPHVVVGNGGGEEHDKILSVSDAEKYIASSTEPILVIFPDDLSEDDKDQLVIPYIDMNIVPNQDKLLNFAISCWNGTVSITRKNFAIIPDWCGNVLKLVVKTPCKSEKIKIETIEAAFPPLYILDDHKGTVVEFQYTDLDKNKEADAFLYPSGIELPKFSADCGRRKCTFKSREVDAKDYDPESEPGSKLNIGYFEVEGKGLSAGEIAGITVGCAVAVAGAAAGIFFFIRFKKAKVAA